MGVGGAKPLPPEVKEVKGNPGRRPYSDRPIPTPPDGPIPIPDWIMRSPRSLACWRHTVASTAPGHLRPLDAHLLGLYCRAIATAEQAMVEMDALLDGDPIPEDLVPAREKPPADPEFPPEPGEEEETGDQRQTPEKRRSALLDETPNGFQVQSVYLTIIRQQTETARKLAAELSLPPGMRNRVVPKDMTPLGTFNADGTPKRSNRGRRPPKDPQTIGQKFFGDD